MIISRIKKIKETELPSYRGDQLYMYPIDLTKNIDLPLKRWQPFIENMVKYIEGKVSEVFLTIDERLIKQGKTHRRGGPHVDGNFLYDWGSGGGNGWLTGGAGRSLNPVKHKKQYCDPRGSMLIVSSYAACRAWIGEFKGQPLQGGNCGHIQDQLSIADTFVLKKNILYHGNSTCVHESLPLDKDIKRQLVRLTINPWEGK